MNSEETGEEKEPRSETVSAVNHGWPHASTRSRRVSQKTTREPSRDRDGDDESTPIGERDFPSIVGPNRSVVGAANRSGNKPLHRNMNGAESRLAGRYRRWNGVTLQGTVLYSTRPLAATRLNETAAEVLDALGTQTFETPNNIAAETDVDPEAAANLLDRLHHRGFLEWAPSRDESYTPPVSVVVTVRDDRKHLLACLDALDTLDYPTYEVVVVDDGSTDGTREVALAHQLADRGRLRVVDVGSPTDPLGIGASRNRGVDAAQYEVIAFTDADCRPRSDWLTALVPSLDTHDIIGGRVLSHGNDPVDVYEGINSSLDMGEYAARIDPDGATPYLPTANFVARRSVLERIPFPDRSIAEDVDVCWRAVELGYNIVYDPAGVVEHDYRDDLSSFAGRRSDYGESEALLAKQYRHGERVPLPGGVLLGVIVALALSAGITGPLNPVITLVLGGLTVAVGVAVVTGRQYWPLRSMVTVPTLLRSRGREVLSRTYAISSEVMRYYSLPLTLVAIGLLATDRSSLAAVGLAGVVVAVMLPATVEYTVENPPISLRTYLRFYLADHLGYQYGAYRGAIVYRTRAHLSPPQRFRLVGPMVAVAAVITSTITPSCRSESKTRTITVDGFRAQFRTETPDESWWFDDETLRGERPVVADFLERLAPDDTVLDVGANVGIYTCFAGRVLPGGRVVAVEPQPANADRLETNVSLNDIDAHIVRRALSSGDRDGQLEVTGSRAGVGTSTLVRDDETASAESADADRIDVGVVAGDTLFRCTDVRPPTVVKIDVEGAEFDVLQGLEGTISSPHCRLVYSEVHPVLLEAFDATPTDIESVLRNRGFVLERIQEWEDRYMLRATRSTDQSQGD